LETCESYSQVWVNQTFRIFLTHEHEIFQF
jgi:hypothetical protein